MILPQVLNGVFLLFEHLFRKHLLHAPMSGKHISTLPGPPFLIPVFIYPSVGMRWRGLEMGKLMQKCTQGLLDTIFLPLAKQHPDLPILWITATSSQGRKRVTEYKDFAQWQTLLSGFFDEGETGSRWLPLQRALIDQGVEVQLFSNTHRLSPFLSS